MIEAYKSLLLNAFNFSGRTRRRDYWLAYLFNFLTLICFSILTLYISIIFYIFNVLYCLFLFIPMLSLTIRRLHDSGKSAFNLLWPFIPIIGSIIFIVFLCLPGDLGNNKYGDDSKRSEFNPELNSL